jgi:divalent metal cation (Fe/Co/Zn/Cd) transporter
LSAEGEEDAKNSALSVKIAVNLSFGCNIVLAIIQLYAAISSGSLALFASCVDSGEAQSFAKRNALANGSV